MKRIRGLTAALVLCTAALLGGCGAAAAGAAGAAAGMAYSDRGAESHVDASIAAVAAATEAALRSMGIKMEERRSEPAETEIEFKAEDGSRKVVVDIEGNRDAGRTHIEVTVSKNAVDYDKSRANEILRAILAQLNR